MRSSSAARAASRVFIPRWNCSGSMICSPIGSTGLSEVIGSWKIIEISRPRTSRMSLFGKREQVAAFEQDAAARSAVARQKPHDRMRRNRLARARLADECHDLAGLDLRAEALDRAHGPGEVAKLHMQVFDCEQGLAGPGGRGT